MIQWFKHRLRRQLQTKRFLLTEHQATSACQQMTTHMLTHPVFTKAQRIAFYIAVKKEMNPEGLIKAALAAQKQCYLPVLMPNKAMHFVEISDLSTLRPNRYGIPEPPHNPNKIIDPMALDLALVPLVGCDSRGHRLGTGGGYYDRSFAEKKPGQTSPILIGLGYQFQKRWYLPRQRWDIRLDGLATEKGITQFND